MPVQKQKTTPPSADGPGDKGSLKKIKRAGTPQSLLDRMDETIVNADAEAQQKEKDEYSGCGC